VEGAAVLRVAPAVRAVQVTLVLRQQDFHTILLRVMVVLAEMGVLVVPAGIRGVPVIPVATPLRATVAVAVVQAEVRVTPEALNQAVAVEEMEAPAGREGVTAEIGLAAVAQIRGAVRVTFRGAGAAVPGQALTRLFLVAPAVVVAAVAVLRVTPEMVETPVIREAPLHTTALAFLVTTQSPLVPEGLLT
jgi:hypothetical protein